MFADYLRRLHWPVLAPALAALAVLAAGLVAVFLFTSSTQAAPLPGPGAQQAGPGQSGGAALPLARSAEPGRAAQSGGPARPATPNDVNRVAKQLYCPVCPNTPLNVCETQACRDWRELIRQKLAAGASDGEIVDYFVAQYGERVLAAPPPQGFNLLVWIIPIAALAAGLAALALILHTWLGGRGRTGVNAPPAGRRVVVSAPATDELPPDYVARVERELQGIRSH